MIAEDILKICIELSESLESDDIEKWSFVQGKVKKSLVPKLKDLKKESDSLRDFLEVYKAILIEFIEIMKILNIPVLQGQMEHFLLSLSVFKLKEERKPAFKVLKKQIEALVKHIQKEIISEIPSKSNVILAMRLFNDLAKLVFRDHPGDKSKQGAKLFKEAIKLQKIYDSSLMKIYSKRNKPNF